MKKIFISYSSKDQEQADGVVTFLEKHDVKCFISSRDLIPGREYAEQLLEQMDSSDAVVVLLSNFSNESVHVNREMEYAVSHHHPIIVWATEEVKLSKSMEYYLMTHQWIRPTDNFEEKLLEGIRGLESEEVPQSEKQSENEILSGTEIAAKDSAKDSPKSILPIIVAAICVVLAVAGILAWIGISKKNKPLEYHPGDPVVFGTYWDEPIEWTVIHVEEDGKTAVLLADHLLCMKAFDAAEGGEYNMYEGEEYWTYEHHIIDDPELLVKVRGSNDWGTSNLRTWLNSENGVVKYEDQPPTYEAVGKNYYDMEEGFLKGFSEEQLAALVPVQHGDVSDRVYLLAESELDYLKDIDKHILYASPTEKCKENDANINTYNEYCQTFYTENYYWWLRDYRGDEANQVNIVRTEGESGDYLDKSSAGSYAFGVRPAVTVDLKKMKDVVSENK